MLWFFERRLNGVETGGMHARHSCVVYLEMYTCTDVTSRTVMVNRRKALTAMRTGAYLIASFSARVSRFNVAPPSHPVQVCALKNRLHGAHFWLAFPHFVPSISSLPSVRRLRSRPRRLAARPSSWRAPWRCCRSRAAAKQWTSRGEKGDEKQGGQFVTGSGTRFGPGDYGAPAGPARPD